MKVFYSIFDNITNISTFVKQCEPCIVEKYKGSSNNGFSQMDNNGFGYFSTKLIECGITLTTVIKTHLKEFTSSV